jgi:hypothetical protein
MSETRDTSVRSNEGAAAVDAPVGRVGGSSPSTLDGGRARNSPPGPLHASPPQTPTADAKPSFRDPR